MVFIHYVTGITVYVNSFWCSRHGFFKESILCDDSTWYLFIVLRLFLSIFHNLYVYSQSQARVKERVVLGPESQRKTLSNFMNMDQR